MFKWQSLKKISDNKAVKSMYFWAVFVPIMAKLLALVESPLNIDFLGSSMSLQLSLPFSWSAFFFAAVSFSLAQILFQLFVPKIINDHSSYAHFKDEGKTRGQLRRYGLEVEFNVADMDKANKDAGAGASSEDIAQQMFWITVDKAENLRTPARWIASILYIVGFALMGFVFVQNIIYVSSHFLN